MFDLDTWQEIFSSLRKNWLRSLLTAFGVSWGIFMLIFMIGAGKGLENGVRGDMDFVTNGLYMWTRRTSVPYKGLQPGRRFRLTNGDVIALKQRVPELDFVAPRLDIGTVPISYSTETESYEVRGEYPEYRYVEKMNILEGRFMNQIDIGERRKVAVIGKQVLKDLFPEGETAIGKYIRIRGSFFQVVGVFESRQDGEAAIDAEQKVIVPLTTMQRLYNFGDQIFWFIATVKATADIDAVEEKVKSILKVRHKVAPEDQTAIGSWNAGKEYSRFQMVFGGINFFIWFAGIFTMIAGIVGVSNIMLISVKERTREIGVRKALGATPLSIVRMILQESVFLTGIAGYLGLMAGFGVILGMNYVVTNFGLENQFFRNPEIDGGVALGAVLLLILTGALAGVIPAYQAAQVEPVEALRDE